VGRTWQQVFETWRDHVVDRPKPTTLACNTAWRQLGAFARRHDVLWPSHLTPTLMPERVGHMRAVEPLAPKTINERRRKIQAVCRMAIGKNRLERHPAADKVKSFSCLDQSCAVAFAQLSFRERGATLADRCRSGPAPDRHGPAAVCQGAGRHRPEADGRSRHKTSASGAARCATLSAHAGLQRGTMIS
jgi:hypothetical protein